MQTRRSTAIGKVVQGIPNLFVMSSGQAQKELGIPMRKMKSENVKIESHNYETTCILSGSPDESEAVIRSAVTAAITAPYLRAVIAISFMGKQASVKVIQPVENRLLPEEYVGALVLTYDQLAKSPYQQHVYFREMNATHMMEGAGFADSLLQHVDGNRKAQSLVINVHHDYLNIHHNLSNIGPLLQIIRQSKESWKT